MSHLLLQCSDKLGLSLELGSFVAGVMISTTDFAEHTLQQVSISLELFFVLKPMSIFVYLWPLHVDF
jgi:Kef-type K+ transport system membrane component KefB